MQVLLSTTAGSLDIELWPKEAPKVGAQAPPPAAAPAPALTRPGSQAVRNFVQLCLEGYYDGCQLFRLLPDFLVQTGDPTNMGRGGESAYGEPFKDEFHSRLKFLRRCGQRWTAHVLCRPPPPNLPTARAAGAWSRARTRTGRTATGASSS